MMCVSMTDSIRTACDEIAGVLLRDGTSVVRYDRVWTEDGIVRQIALHVVADRDIETPIPDPECPIDHDAGDCWQEVWYAFNRPGEPVSVGNAMRVV